MIIIAKFSSNYIGVEGAKGLGSYLSKMANLTFLTLNL